MLHNQVAYDDCAIQKYPYYADVEQVAIPGILVDPGSGLQTSENGGTDSFTVVLASEPTAEVSIGLSSSETSEGGVSPTLVTFDSSDCI